MLVLSVSMSAQIMVRPGVPFSHGNLRPNFCCRPHHEGPINPVPFFPVVTTPFYFDEGTYTALPATQPTVLVIRDEKEPAEPPKAATAQPPKIVEFPIPRGTKTQNHPAIAIFICSNGRKVEATDYSITYSAVLITHLRQQPETIALDQLDVDATLRANSARGLNLRIPRNKSEIFLSF